MNQLPKIQWKNFTVNGTTAIGSNTITGISDTSNIETDMLIEDSEFPSGTKVVSTTSSTIVLNDVSTGVTTSDRDFYFQLSFIYPPTTDDTERVMPKTKKRDSQSGIRQILTNYIEYKLSLSFSFLTLTELNEIKNFYSTHASLGNEFRYFPDSDEVTYVTYEADTLGISPKKVTQILYAVKFLFRRVEWLMSQR